MDTPTPTATAPLGDSGFLIEVIQPLLPNAWKETVEKTAAEYQLQVLEDAPSELGVLVRVKQPEAVIGSPLDMPYPKRVTVFKYECARALLRQREIETTQESATALRNRALREGLLFGAALLALSGSIFVTWWQRHLGYVTLGMVSMGSVLASTGIAALLVWASATGLWRPSELGKAEDVLRRQQELINRVAAGMPEGTVVRAEQPKAAITIRTTSLKDDMRRITGRSRVAFAIGVVFLVLVIGGPLAALWLVVTLGDWHFLAGGFAVVIGPLAAGGLLLRYDNKLRAENNAAAREIAFLDRLQVALDCARAHSEEELRATLREVTRVLLQPQGLPPVAAATEEEDASGPIEAVAKAVTPILEATRGAKG
jgi:hypothetical protein